MLIAAPHTGCSKDPSHQRLETIAGRTAARVAELDRLSAALDEVGPTTLVETASAAERILPDADPLVAQRLVGAALGDEVSVRSSTATTSLGQLRAQPTTIELGSEWSSVVAALATLERELASLWEFERASRCGTRYCLEVRHFQVLPASWTDDGLGLDPGPDEAGWFASGSNALRDQIRTDLRRTDELRARLTASGMGPNQQSSLIAARFRRALIADLEPRLKRVQKDRVALFAALRSLDAPPISVGFSVRRGRRQCAITVSSTADRLRLASASLANNLATDRSRSEIVLPSGRVCRVAEAR